MLRNRDVRGMGSDMRAGLGGVLANAIKEFRFFSQIVLKVDHSRKVGCEQVFSQPIQKL
jgi:hypothetical protein